MFGTSGIRGEVGEDVTGALALDLGRALGSMTDRIVVGRDARGSGEALAGAAIAGALETGTDVVDLGVESTPTVARSVAPFDGDAGLVVTASHNPPSDNGFKFWTTRAQAFETAKIETLSRRFESAAEFTVRAAEVGSISRVSTASQRHLEALPTTGGHSLSVVVDLGNGTGQVTIEALRSRGCTVRTLDADRDGDFPGRPSEPTAGHCSMLSAVVGETDAALGIAHDGDADRMMVVDETGRFVSGDELLALFASKTVPDGATVAAPINASSRLDRVLEESGGSVVRTPVGDGHVAAACAREGVAFGGEPSGAWIWPDETLCPDGHFAALQIVDILAEGPPLSERLAALPEYVTKRVSIEATDPDEVVRAATARLRDRYAVTDVDGVRVDTDDGWFLLRASGTEPVVRVTAEASTERRAAELLEEASEHVRSPESIAQE